MVRIFLIGLFLAAPALADGYDRDNIRVGIIGLDTSHAIAFTKLLNDKNAEPDLAGCRVVAAYPKGSRDIESSTSRVPKYTKDIQQYGVAIVDSIDALLAEVDVVLLESNDGRPHLEQIRPVLAARKPVFVDKPVAGSLADAIKIYREAEIAQVPVFSSSSLRYSTSTQQVRSGSLGRVLHCETSSPATLEPTHPDLFWYGIHGVESLFTVMGVGCQTVQRTTEDDKIVVTGSWPGGRTGVFREGGGYSGTARGEQGEAAVGDYESYRPLLVEIVKFFRTGKPPVSAEETLEIYAFMEAADESKRRGGDVVALSAVMQAAADYSPLFNGHDLSGWKGLVANPAQRAQMSADDLATAQRTADQSMRDHWKAVDGTIEFDGKGDSLCTIADYGDFEMYLDWKIGPGGDSGIYLRGSPQVQIWDTEYEDYFRLGADQGSGAFWNNEKHPRFPLVLADRPHGQWNTFYIRMVGERATVKLNGQLVVDDTVMENYWDRSRPIYQEGQIELQNHGSKLWFKNLFIREILPDEANAILATRGREGAAVERLFNGRDLEGWTGAVDSYEVVNNELRCKPGGRGNLVSKEQYADFVAQMEFKLPPGGNNGVAIRYSGHGRPADEGIEIQILDSEHPKYADLDPRQYHGSIYGLVAAQRGYLRSAGQWNFQRISARGTQVTVELNGFTIVDADLSLITESKDGPVPTGARRAGGHFGFASHNDPVAFRNVTIRDLSGTDAQVAP